MSSPPARPRGPLAVWISLCICAAAAFWISNGVAPWNGDTHNAWHHYEYLAEGFLHGHTYLPVEPDPRLLRLKDPYDPDANKPYRLWDASLYRGKYYLYYGPAPAIVLMMPWRILTGQALPQRLAVGAFGAFGIAGLALLLWEVRNRHFPRVTSAALSGIVIVAFCAAWLPVALRRPAFWEMPIVSAVAFLWWSIYFLWKFHDSGGRARWAVAGGAALALLMGCRVTFVFSAGAIALLFLAPGPGGISRRRAALAAGAIAFAGGIGLLLYNRARFGSWLEFGQSYQLWGAEYRGLHFFNPGNLLFNARTYLFSLPQVGPYFPFLHPFWTDDRPEGYMGFEEIYGAIFMMPVHLAGLIACDWVWRNRATPGTRPLSIALSSSVCASIFAGLILFSWGGACSRYMTELLGGWTVATSVGLMAVLGREPARRGAARALAVAAASWTVACVCLASAEYRGFMKQTNPGTYSALAHALDAPSQWWIRGHGIRFGPAEMILGVPACPDGTRTILVAAGRPQRVNQLVLERVDSGHVRLELVQNELLILQTPPIAVRGDRLRVRLAAPWLYPPPEHPFWDSLDPAAARELQTFFSLKWDSGGVQAHSTHCADAVGFEPAVDGPSFSDPGSPCVERFGPADSIR
jgi:hypothetical protein